MYASDAKKIQIISYLESENIEKKHVSNGEIKYLSPFRPEKEPSFSVNINKNSWYDFGLGKGGNIIDLVCEMKRCSVSDSLQILSGIKNIDSFSFSQQNNPIQESKIEIKHEQKLQNNALIQYLESRKIPFWIAEKFVIEVYYKVLNTNALQNKQYFALAFRNNKGGYELRNQFFKNCTSPKHFSTIKGLSNEQITIFEGFMDFLSAMVHFGTIEPKFTTIVLNSTSLIPLLLPQLTNYKRINLFLDNDDTGKKAKQKFIDTGIETHDFSGIYKDYKDFNEFIIKK